MFALVKDGQVVRTVREESIEWNGFTYSNVFLLTPAERKAAGVFAFIAAQPNPPEGQKVQGTTIEIGDGVVTESPIYVDKTPEELANELNAKRDAMTVTPWQIRKAMNLVPGMREIVEAAVEAGDQTVKDAWQYATEFRRSDPLVSSVAYGLGKTDEEIDEFFQKAVTL